MTKDDSIMPPKWFITCAFFILFVWLIFELKEIVTLIIVGYCIAYLLNPLITFLEQKKIPRAAAVLATFTLLLFMTIVLLGTAIPTVIRDYRELVGRFPQFYAEISKYLSPLMEEARQVFNVPANGSSIAGIFSLIDAQSLNRIISGTFKALLKGYSITLTILNLILLPFIAFYLCVDFNSIHEKGLKLIVGKHRSKVARIVSEMDLYVSAFVRGQLLVGFILALLYAIGLGFIGVELWLLLALISGFGNIVPYLGFLSGIIFSSLMALSTFGDFKHVLYVWIVFFVVQSLESFIITPKVIGDKVGISPLVIILAILAAGKLFGFLGIFLAVPGAAIFKVLARHLHELISNNHHAVVK